MNICFASKNAGKLAEVSQFLQSLAFSLSAFEDPIPESIETAHTFIENALIKARFVAEKTSGWVLADDSGLVVPALAGAPGVYSSRYAGEDATSHDNIKKLLKAMHGMTGQERHAYFICYLVLLRHPDDPAPIIATGTWHGEILQAPQGAKGFGYDPVFYLPGQQCSAAELSLEEKNTLSHRGLALKQLHLQLHNEKL